MRTLLKLLFLFGFVLVFSCQKQVKPDLNKQQTKDSIKIKTAGSKKINAMGEVLNSTIKPIIKSWKEYVQIEELLNRYYAISPSEALSNANELATLASELKDSIRIKRLEIPEIKVRLNVLNSECLRLKDMSEIPAIKPEEVTTKVTEILDAFSALNAKINSIYAVDDLEGQLELDPDFQAMINSSQEAMPVTKNKSASNKASVNIVKKPVKKLNKKLKFNKNSIERKRLLLKKDALKRQLNK